ncbi:Acetolactate synthase, mitochondrial [Metarhizium acridum]|nr:Acetolactate synthase, mitochondrial [Metarhizium acridum]
MLRSHQASKALRAVSQTRSFTYHPSRCLKASEKIPSGQRNQATAATATSSAPRVRAVPSPAFNAADQSHVQPLANQPKNDMDESYVQPAIAATGAQFQDECTWAHSEFFTSAD